MGLAIAVARLQFRRRDYQPSRPFLLHKVSERAYISRNRCKRLAHQRITRPVLSMKKRIAKGSPGARRLLAQWIPTIAVAAGLLGLHVVEPSAQAWVQPKDGYYFKVSGSVLHTNDEFNFEGDRQPIFAEDLSRRDTSFRDVSITGYLEYGLSNNLTLVATVPFKILTSKDTRTLAGQPIRRTSATNGGLSDLFVSLRAPIVQGPLAMSLQGGIKLPLGYEKEPDNDGPPLGTGEIDAQIDLHAGHSLYPIPAYVSAGVGYRLRGGELHDEVSYSVEGGYTAGPVFLKLRFDGLQNVTDPPDLAGLIVMTPLPGGGGVTPTVVVGDQDVFKISPTVSYLFTESFSLTAEAFHTIAGKNTVAGTSFAVGVVYTRK
jgi:hypothetical protein